MYAIILLFFFYYVSHYIALEEKLTNLKIIQSEDD